MMRQPTVPTIPEYMILLPISDVFLKTWIRYDEDKSLVIYIFWDSDTESVDIKFSVHDD